MKILALPGLDGTADLFEPFARSAPDGFEVATVSYPPDRALDYAGHLEIARRHLPADGPFLLLGESFSGPVSVWLAAEAPPGLTGLVLCNTFVRPPSWSGFRHLPWELLFRRCLKTILAVKPETRVAEIEAPHMLLQIAPREAWSALEELASSTVHDPGIRSAGSRSP